jgi:hypothetical protein
MNPEFQRNCWLEVTPLRLLCTPLVLAGFFAILYYVFPEVLRSRALMQASIFIFILFGFWGMAKANSAVTDEVRSRTWDFQRMSALSPWSMTWGKLLGSTIMAWYGGLICLAVGGYSTAAYHGTAEALSLVSAFAILALITQAGGILFSLDNLELHRYDTKQLKSGLNLLVFAVFGMPILSAGWLMVFSFREATEPSVAWYGLSFAFSHFFVASALIFLGWVTLGVYRFFRRELQFRDAPLAWLAFLVFLMIYLSGFIDEQFAPYGVYAQRFYSSFIIAVLAVYLSIFREPKDIAVFRRLFLSGNTWRVFCLTKWTPRWLVSIYVAVILCIVQLVFFPFSMPYSGQVRNSYASLIILLICLRDLLLIVGIHFGRGTPGRKNFGAIVALVILHILFPSLFLVIKLREGAICFWPWSNISGAAGILIALSWVVIVLSLVKARWVRLAGEIQAN